MHKIHKKEYNVFLRSFISRAFLGTIVVFSLFACKGVSQEDLDEVEKKAKEEAKAETEKVKKELGDKITALEGRSPAVITGADYTNIKGAVGLGADGKLDAAVGGSLAEDVVGLKTFKTAVQASVGLDSVGDLDYAVGGSLAEQVDGLDQSVTGLDQSVTGLNQSFNALDQSIKAVRTVLGMNIADNNIDYKQGLAKRINDMHLFIEGIKVSLGLAGNGTINSSGLSGTVEQIRDFMIEAGKSVGLGNDGKLIDKTINGSLAENVAAMPAKIVKGINALGAKIKLSSGNSPKITLADLS